MGARLADGTDRPHTGTDKNSAAPLAHAADRRRTFPQEGLTFDHSDGQVEAVLH